MEREGCSTFCFGAAIGSEKPKKGRARLMKPFLYDSTCLLPLAICVWRAGVKELTFILIHVACLYMCVYVCMYVYMYLV